MIVSIRRWPLLRPVRIAWRAMRAQRFNPPDEREAKPQIGFFQAFRKMHEHQIDLMFKDIEV